MESSELTKIFTLNMHTRADAKLVLIALLNHWGVSSWFSENVCRETYSEWKNGSNCHSQKMRGFYLFLPCYLDICIIMKIESCVLFFLYICFVLKKKSFIQACGSLKKKYSTLGIKEFIWPSICYILCGSLSGKEPRPMEMKPSVWIHLTEQRFGRFFFCSLHHFIQIGIVRCWIYVL